jgi:hypothetical protein
MPDRLDAGVRRIPWWLVGAAVALGTSIAIAAGFAFWVWTWPLGVTDRLTAIGDTAAVAGLIDAAIAGSVAVAAYYRATRVPDMQLFAAVADEGIRSLPVAAGPRMEPTATVSTLQSDTKRIDALIFRRDPYLANEKLQVRFVLANKGKYSARNPAVRIYINVTAVDSTSLSWPYDPSLNAIQWDGGSDLAIHGTWSRQLPLLQCLAIGPVSNDAYLFPCEVVAEGFRRDFELWIQFVDVNR